jgi:hypothetical protein
MQELNQLKTELYVHYILKFSSHLTENGMPIIKTWLLFSFRKIIDVCCEDRMGHIIALCGQNSAFINVTAVGACICHWALNG